MIIGFLIISTVVATNIDLVFIEIIGFLIISTVVAIGTMCFAIRDNWFPYNFYCCSLKRTENDEKIIGFLIISTVVALLRRLWAQGIIGFLIISTVVALTER